MEALRREVEAERQDAARLAAVRQRVIPLLEELDLESWSMKNDSPQLGVGMVSPEPSLSNSRMSR